MLSLARFRCYVVLDVALFRFLLLIPPVRSAFVHILEPNGLVIINASFLPIRVFLQFRPMSSRPSRRDGAGTPMPRLHVHFLVAHS